MSATKTLNLRVDAELKAQAEQIFSELGLPTSTAITMFLKSVVRYGGIPFELRTHSPNKETEDALKEYENMKAHPEQYKRYSSFKDAMHEVLADA